TDEVLVRVAVAGLCGTDYRIWSGDRPVAYPRVMGHEFVGRVETVGAGVTRVAPGDRVAVEPNYSCGTCPLCREGNKNLCLARTAVGIDVDGCFAELVRVPARCCCPAPAGAADADLVLTQRLAVAVPAGARAGARPRPAGRAGRPRRAGPRADAGRVLLRRPPRIHHPGLDDLPGRVRRGDAPRRRRNRQDAAPRQPPLRARHDRRRLRDPRAARLHQGRPGDLMPHAVINKIRMHYEVAGQGASVLLINGLSAPSVGFILQVKALAPHFQVVTFDNRGVGETDLHSEPVYSTAQLADDAAALLHHLEISRAHVLGTSMGGTIAMELALRHPRLVRSLTLACTWAEADARFLHTIEAWISLAYRVPVEERYRYVVYPWIFSPEFLAKKENVEQAVQRALAYPHQTKPD